MRDLTPCFRVGVRSSRVETCSAPTRQWRSWHPEDLAETLNFVEIVPKYNDRRERDVIACDVVCRGLWTVCVGKVTSIDELSGRTIGVYVLPYTLTYPRIRADKRQW